MKVLITQTRVKDIDTMMNLKRELTTLKWMNLLIIWKIS